MNPIRAESSVDQVYIADRSLSFAGTGYAIPKNGAAKKWKIVVFSLRPSRPLLAVGLVLLGVQHFAHLSRQGIGKERLLQKRGAGFRNPVVHHGFFGIPGNIQHAQFGEAGRSGGSGPGRSSRASRRPPPPGRLRPRASWQAGSASRPRVASSTLVAASGQHVHDQLAHARLVFHQQDGFGAGRRHSARQLSRQRLAAWAPPSGR